MSYSKVSTSLPARQIVGAFISLSLLGTSVGVFSVIPQQIAEAEPIEYYSVKTGSGTWVVATKKGSKYMDCAGKPIVGWRQAFKSDGRTCGG